MLSRCVHDEVQNDRLHVLAADPRDDPTIRLENDSLAATSLQVLGNFQNSLHQFRNVGRLAAMFADPAEFEQPARDALAAECFLLNHPQVFLDHIRLVRIAGQIVRQTRLQGLRAERDGGERIVDLVSHAGGQEADADHPFRAHQLPASFVDLMFEIAIDFVQPGHHAVECDRQIFQFVARFQDQWDG